MLDYPIGATQTPRSMNNFDFAFPRSRRRGTDRMARRLWLYTPQERNLLPLVWRIYSARLLKLSRHFPGPFSARETISSKRFLLGALIPLSWDSQRDSFPFYMIQLRLHCMNYAVACLLWKSSQISASFHTVGLLLEQIPAGRLGLWRGNRIACLNHHGSSYECGWSVAWIAIVS